MLNTLKEKYIKIPIQVKASLWFLICSFLQKGISVITTPIFTRLLSTSEYGQYGVFNSWLSIIAVFVSLHLYSGVCTTGLVKFSDERDVFASSLQGLSLTLTVGWTVIYLVAVPFWNGVFGLTTVQMLAMLVMIWASATFNLWACEQRVKLNYKTLVIATLIVSVLKPVVSIILVLNAEDKVTARILGLALVELVCYTAFFFIQMNRGKAFFSKKYWTYALKFNIPLIPHYLSQSVLNGADKIMIKQMIGESQAGIYALAYSISLVMTIFNTALGHTISPWIYQKIKDRKENSISKVAYTSLVGIAAVNLVLIGFAPEVTSVFAPSEYYEAIYIIPPVAMSAYFMFAYDLFAKLEFYFEKTKWIAGTTMASAALNIILNYIFINLFGYKAAGYTTLFCYILYALFHYFMMKKVCKEYMDGIRVYDPRILLGITVAFMGFGFCFLLLYKLPITRYALIAIIVLVGFIFRKKIIKTAKEVMAK